VSEMRSLCSNRFLQNARGALEAFLKHGESFCSLTLARSLALSLRSVTLSSRSHHSLTLSLSLSRDHALTLSRSQALRLSRSHALKFLLALTLSSLSLSSLTGPTHSLTLSLFYSFTLPHSLTLSSHSLTL